MSSHRSGKAVSPVLAGVLLIVAAIVLAWSYTHYIRPASTNAPIPMPGNVNMQPGGVSAPSGH